MAMLSTQPSAPCNVTKLLLPSESSVQLDSSLLAQAEADNQNIIYHVTTDASDSQVVAQLLSLPLMFYCSCEVPSHRFMLEFG